MTLSERIGEFWLHSGIQAHAYWTREIDYARDFEEFKAPRRDLRTLPDLALSVVEGLSFLRDIPMKALRGAGLGVIASGLGSIAVGEPHPSYLIEGASFGANVDFLVYVGRGLYRDLSSRDQP